MFLFDMTMFIVYSDKLLQWCFVWGTFGEASILFIICSLSQIESSLCFMLILGIVKKLQKATISFIMSVRLFLSLHETAHLPLGGFSWNLVFEYFSKIYGENWSFITIGHQDNGFFTLRPTLFLIISHWILLRMWNFSDISYRWVKTHFMFKTFFNFAVCKKMWKNV